MSAIEKTPEAHASTAANIGLVLMGAAATLSIMTVTDRSRVRQAVIAPQTTVLSANANNTNPIRREKEDTETHYVSYREAQRTHATTGKK